jgi:hypothetical protein
VYEIKGGGLLPERFTETFHGRDIFAPAAAHIARGVKPRRLGVKTSTYVEAAIPEARLFKGKIRGEVVYVDRFGNLVTNIGRELLASLNVKPGGVLKLSFRRPEGKPLKVNFLRAYAEAEAGELLTLIGSWGTLEVSANQAKASDRLKVKAGEKLWVKV